jgi:hypothetical protein
MLALPDSLHPRTRERVLEWTADPDVLGVIWVGSKSRGHGDTMSDDDLEVLLAPLAFDRVAPADSYVMERDSVAKHPRLVYDAQLTSLAVLQGKASSPHDLDHWPYEQASVLFERDGDITDAVRSLATMDRRFRQARIHHGALDAVLAIARARKTEMRGFRAATSMVVVRGVKALSRVLFALENRWVPLDHWLEPELRSLADELGVGPLLVEALADCRYQPLQEALERLHERLEDEGFPPPHALPQFCSEMMHPSRADERAIHGLN